MDERMVGEVSGKSVYCLGLTPIQTDPDPKQSVNFTWR
jgi:hypothetical protein